MLTPVLATKLYIPPPPPKAVQRPRLIERLNAGLPRKLTLIAAPAGFGKTTLVSAWLAGSAQRAAWLSLDEGDSDPARFLTYVVAALQTVVAHIGAELLHVLQTPQPPPAQVILTALLNEIATIPDTFVLVLDDYHRVDAKPVDAALTFLLEHLPPQLQLVITTREDPQLPLARLRARGQLTELRAADLRFTFAEVAQFLNKVIGLDLAEADIGALEIRTEGWIAGLQLAALSLQGHQDVPAFIRSFAGDHRYIMDYLIEEVLQRQPEPVRRFLLQTAILARLHGPLCDAVTGQPDGAARLAALERGNFFVVPLDDQRQWYRYHHLFGEVLYAHLQAEQPDEVSTLHQRASAWYQHHGLMVEAINHALAAPDVARAADLLEQAVPALRSSRQDAMLRAWLKALPDQLLQARPVLSVWYAHSLLASGELAGVDEHLRNAEQWLESLDTPDIAADEDAHRGSQARPAGMVVVDEAAFRALPGTIAIARAGQAMALGDVGGTMKYAQRVSDLVPADDHVSRGGAAAFLGLAFWLKGDLDAAHHSFAAGMAHLQMAGYTADAIGGAITLADIRIAQGRLHDALRTYEHGLQLATRQTEQGTPALRGTADMHVGIGAILCERNDLDAAVQQMLCSKELGEHTGFPQNRYRRHVAMSRIRVAQGDLEGALDLLGAAERMYMRGLLPDVRPVAALRAQVWIAQGMPASLGKATAWAHEQGLSTEDALSYPREFEHITLARLLLAVYKREQHNGADGSTHAGSGVMGLLDRLLQAAEEGGRQGSVIEILALQACAHQVHSDIPAALVPLQRALALAEPAGYVRLFLDEGPPMALLLHEAAHRRIAPHYVRQLLQAAGAADENQNPIPVKHALVEPLSARELEVLRLLQTHLSGPEIAQALTVSLNTMHSHTKSIYTKLGVNSRRAAVGRAEEFHLL